MERFECLHYLMRHMMLMMLSRPFWPYHLSNCSQPWEPCFAIVCLLLLTSMLYMPSVPGLCMPEHAKALADQLFLCLPRIKDLLLACEPSCHKVWPSHVGLLFFFALSNVYIFKDTIICIYLCPTYSFHSMIVSSGLLS